MNRRDREYLDAWAGLTEEQRAELAAAGITGPELDHNCVFRPDYQSDIPVAPEDPFAEPDHEEKILDVIRRIIGELLSHSNPALAIECLSFVTGISYMGNSQTEIAKRHGISRAAVSKRCIELSEAVGLDPSRAMKSKKARNKYAKQARDHHSRYER